MSSSDYRRGVEAGLAVAREIADWLIGQDQRFAVAHIERMRIVLQENFLQAEHLPQKPSEPDPHSPPGEEQP